MAETPYEPYGGDVGQGSRGQEAEPAGLGKRFLARLLDGIVITIPLLILGAIVGLGASASIGNTGAGAGSIVLGIIAALVQLAYFTYLESSRGQTLGKMALSLRTQTESGGLPSLEQAAKRNAWILLGIVPLIGGLAVFAAVIAIAVTIGSDALNRGWHDKFGDTIVVDT